MMIRTSTLLLPLAALVAAALADDYVTQHDFEGDGFGIDDFKGQDSGTVDVELFDRAPHGVGIDRWANLMHDATHMGHWPIQGFDTMLPNRTAMDGWSVTYALNNWIDANTTVLRRDTDSHKSWPGAVVRLNPPEDLWARASARFSDDDYVYPENVPADTRAYSARHRNWRVCAYRFGGIGDAETWFKAPDDQTCGGHLEPGCIGSLAGQTISTNAFNNHCPYLLSEDSEDMGGRGSEAPNECLADFIYEDVDVKYATPPSSLSLRYRNWTSGTMREEESEMLEEYDWLHGSELWSVGTSSMAITGDRLRGGGYEEDGEELEDGKHFDRELRTVVQRGQGLLLAWVHNEDGLVSNTTSPSNVTFSLVCFNGINETSVGEQRLDEVIELYARGAAPAGMGADLSMVVAMGVLALASSVML